MFKRRTNPVITLTQRRTPTRTLARDDEAVGLLSALRAALPQKRCCSVGIISTLHGEGVSTLAQSLAAVAARNPRTKVLLCKVANQRNDGDSSAPFIFMETVTSLPSDRVTANNVGGFPLAHAATSYGDNEVSMGALSAPSDLQSIVTSVGGSFDLVIVELPPVHSSALGPSLTRGLDGVLLVVEAERTRTHAMRAAKTAIESCGGNIVGVVLNKRRFHIPDFIYRHL
ncbi:MAG: ATPase involved in chromosome partitioning-like [Myxococcaceae bacterium]|nr:ATPase involved in chromosome partitioning-like [Myxococcaceae bacterium]